jgi:hypothetical protein
MENNVIQILISVIACFATYYIQHGLKQKPVFASSIATLIFIVFYEGFCRFTDLEAQPLFPILFFGATFVGMSSNKILRNYSESILAGGIFGFIFIITQPFFVGYGGGLGARAFLSVMSVLGVFFLLNVIRNITGKFIRRNEQ